MEHRAPHQRQALFLSTPSARRATTKRGLDNKNRVNFYPRPPRGGRRQLSSVPTALLRFLSTPSARRATGQATLFLCRRIRNFYPRPPRGGRPLPPGVLAPPFAFLSTPSARRATIKSCQDSLVTIISIHALREEGDRKTQPQLPAGPYFYPRPPRGGRLDEIYHALRDNQFLSTPSARRATNAAQSWQQMLSISIHALREEGDNKRHRNSQEDDNFYPRPPRGGRRLVVLFATRTAPFLSTPSARRATTSSRCACAAVCISIHALREEGDIKKPVIVTSGYNFYPRPPRGGRPVKVGTAEKRTVFLSTPSARRATHRRRASKPQVWISIHALREEGDSGPRCG